MAGSLREGRKKECLPLVGKKQLWQPREKVKTFLRKKTGRNAGIVAPPVGRRWDIAAAERKTTLR